MDEEKTCAICKEYVNDPWETPGARPLKKLPFAMGALCGFWRCESCGLVYFWPNKELKDEKENES